MDPLEKYFEIIRKERFYSSPANLKFYLRYLFGDISFQHKRMLDIGGGSGLFSFYAACMGASEVVCLEPGMEGFLYVTIDKYEKLRSELEEVQSVTRLSTDIQHYDEHGPGFDIILLHNSINHLEEESCIRLHEDREARETYHRLFLKIGNLAKHGARLIIADCSSDNFFHRFHIRNPFAWDIEWHKHQPPGLWIQILKKAGFSNPKLRWRSFDQLRTPGRLLTGNRIIAYFLQSHFCLTMTKK